MFAIMALYVLYDSKNTMFQKFRQKDNQNVQYHDKYNKDAEASTNKLYVIIKVHQSYTKI